MAIKILELFLKKNRFKKHVKIMHSAKCTLSHLENPFYKSLSSVQKTAPKNTKYSRNEIILKISHHAKAIAHAKSLLLVKN